MSHSLLDEILKRPTEGVELVVSGNPSCSLQIEKGLREWGLNIQLAHPVELLDWSLRGTGL